MTTKRLCAEPSPLIEHPAKFSDPKYCEKRIYIFQIVTRPQVDHVIKGICAFNGGSLSR